jgi:hypothetical protein
MAWAWTDVASPQELLEEWQSIHGTLKPELQKQFIKHPAVEGILIYDRPTIGAVLQNERKLEKVLMALNSAHEIYRLTDDDTEMTGEELENANSNPGVAEFDFSGEELENTNSSSGDDFDSEHNFEVE